MRAAGDAGGAGASRCGRRSVCERVGPVSNGGVTDTPRLRMRRLSHCEARRAAEPARMGGVFRAAAPFNPPSPPHCAARRRTKGPPQIEMSEAVDLLRAPGDATRPPQSIPRARHPPGEHGTLSVPVLLPPRPAPAPSGERSPATPPPAASSSLVSGDARPPARPRVWRGGARACAPASGDGASSEHELSPDHAAPSGGGGVGESSRGRSISLSRSPYAPASSRYTCQKPEEGCRV
jgi:hypothetical protein